MIYIDHNQNLQDTIRIFIPSGKSIVKSANADTAVVRNVKPPVRSPADSTPEFEQPAAQMKTDTANRLPEEKYDVKNKDTVVAKKTDEVKQPEDKPEDSAAVPANKTAAKQDDIVVLPKVVQSSTTNSDCKAFAANEDFLKLRKKMASEKRQICKLQRSHQYKLRFSFLNEIF